MLQTNLMGVKEFYSFIDRNPETTSHIKERDYRFKHLDSNARVVNGFIAIIDKFHDNGAEIHALYDDGSIRIYNLNTKKLITVLIARPEQAQRLNPKMMLPKYLWNKCRDNLNKRYNH